MGRRQHCSYDRTPYSKPCHSLCRVISLKLFL
uniref:Uncharacterized protein n=1 Tax=Rhizophora mucronata TaxID=61149 RepID=A0A2P2Q0G7_RHIMU